MPTAAATKPVRITRRQLQEHEQLSAQMKALQQQLDTLERKREGIRDDVRAYLAQERTTRTELHGFQLALVDGRAVVKWKDAFIRECGVDAANKLSANAPKSKSLQITKL